MCWGWAGDGGVGAIIAIRCIHCYNKTVDVNNTHSMQQIRITKNEEMEKVLDFFHQKYPLLEDNEIVKMTLSIVYTDMQSNDWLTEEEEKNVGISLQELKQGKGFKGTAKEVIKWLES